ncbi:MAG: ABC transporter permease [Thermoprotei archaeon]|nr:MAG: ABC transporter permease [Thermoprotei archaeon]
MHELVQYLLQPFVIRALISAVLTSTIAAMIGSFMVFRGLSFMASGVAHAALGGAALGLFLQVIGLSWFDPILGALLFGVLVAVVTGYVGERGIASKMEVAIGVTFAFAMSIAVLFMTVLPAEHIPRIWGLLVGDILLLTNTDILILLVSSIIVSLITMLFFKEFIYISFDIEGASAHGMNVRLYNYLLLILMAISIIVAVKSVGAILVYTVMIIPAATASEVGESIHKIIVLIFIIAFLSQFVGIVASYYIGTSPSAIAGIISSTIYMIVIVKKRIKA